MPLNRFFAFLMQNILLHQNVFFRFLMVTMINIPKDATKRRRKLTQEQSE